MKGRDIFRATEFLQQMQDQIFLFHGFTGDLGNDACQFHIRKTGFRIGKFVNQKIQYTQFMHPVDFPR